MEEGLVSRASSLAAHLSRRGCDRWQALSEELDGPQMSEEQQREMLLRSVKADNARELLGADEVGGALVGGASLTAESFMGIVIAAAEVHEA